MLGEGGTKFSDLQTAARAFLASGETGIELKDFRVVIDSQEGDFAARTRDVRKVGGHLSNGAAGVVSWIGRTCGMSSSSVADRLCVGTQLESLPKIAEALRTGQISYQSTALLCHLRDQLGDQAELFDEDEEDYSRRRLHLSLMADGMHAIDGILDPAGGAALRTALDTLSKRKGPEDDRDHKQRMADSLVELVHHAMDEGTLPRRNGVKPHVTLTTTIEGLKNELGAPPADLELSLPISTRTLERIACDSTISRVLLADSMVIDVGRATRVVSAPTRRALRTRDGGCRWPGCDRPVNWSTPHHIEFWARGGANNLPNLVLLCFFHHRLVHEGGWQVVKAGREFRFLPPERVVMRRARGPGISWAA
ncbi:MAG: HNH endonuclease [Candidatus Dormibacteraeota bacterium]|nr:HNH endonuclease [Candidatus Dormibacteraeota bacterium]